jgi:hypothetical protein
LRGWLSTIDLMVIIMATITTYPKAEAIARKMPLFKVIEPVAKELYGIASPVLDMGATKKYLSLHFSDDLRYFNNPEVLDVIVSILESRLNRLKK